jgi:hypothetical protein
VDLDWLSALAGCWLLAEPRLFPRWHERHGDVFMLHSTGFAPPLVVVADEDGQGLSPAELRDQLMTLLIAGHETTATALAWSIERLLRNPRVMRRLAVELADDRDEYLGARESRRPARDRGGVRYI